jgi:predicted metal-dependent enzyme (double-stranded beta helix superfamily)
MSLATLPAALAPAMLTSIAAGLASAIDPDDYGFALDDDRGYALLLRTDAYEAWLIAWAPGGSLDLHDHGGSTGEVVVVEGELLERYTDRRCGHPLRTHRLRAGQALAIGPTRVHGVWNPGPTTALSVHVYSPPLSTMTFYDPRRLTPLRTEPADISA